MNKSRTILQIVPRTPGTRDGVGDYALRLAERLLARYETETIFAAAAPTSASHAGDFRVFAPLDSISAQAAKVDHIILHYVNYGYQKRGVPFQLAAILRRLRRDCNGKLLTVFHELYASGSLWQSAFWLQPWQKSIARTVAQLSDACVVSSEPMREMLLRLAPETSVTVHPVISTLGEPNLSAAQFVRRDPHTWAIFGGTHLLERSLRSLRSKIAAIPASLMPKKLFLLGGNENAAVRAEIKQLRELECDYLPAIEVAAASEILSTCAFGWIDYFRQHTVPTAAILKSGSFASYCAHGVIPVLPHRGSVIAVDNDPSPGPYFVEANRTNLPASTDRAKISEAIYHWYRRHSSIDRLAKAVATLLVKS